jgi:hypothetical protein
MADMMHLLTAASTDLPVRDEHSRSSRVTRRKRVMSPPVVSNACARLPRALALALAVVAGIPALVCSAAADETSDASRRYSAVAIASRPGVAGRQRIPAHRTDPQTVDPDPSTRFVEKLYEQLMHPTAR